MVNYDKFKKVISAIVTPMNHDESINYDALSLLVTKQLERGVEGFYCCGSSGEGPLLNLEERNNILATITKVVQKKVPVISHVGTVRTADAVSLAKNAEQNGADAVSLVPPYYYNFNQQEIIAYYKKVLSAISIPVIIYNIPQFTKVDFDKKFASALLTDEQVLGIKHTSHNMYSLERMTSEYPDKVYFNGFDEIYFSSLAAGANATVGTTVNIQPELFLYLRKLFQQGNFDKAREVQKIINNVIEYLVDRGIFQSAKYLAGYNITDLGPIREPFTALTEVQKDELDKFNSYIQEMIKNVEL